MKIFNTGVSNILPREFSFFIRISPRLTSSSPITIAQSDSDLFARLNCLPKDAPELSRSTAAHSTLIIDDNSSCHFKKINENYFLNNGLKIIKKDIVFEKNYWKINAAHDGYQKKY